VWATLVNVDPSCFKWPALLVALNSETIVRDFPRTDKPLTSAAQSRSVNRDLWLGTQRGLSISDGGLCAQPRHCRRDLPAVSCFTDEVETSLLDYLVK
jgi:hypothetical protein